MTETTISVDKNIILWFSENGLFPPGIPIEHVCNTLRKKPQGQKQKQRRRYSGGQDGEYPLTVFGMCLLETGYLLAQLILSAAKRFRINSVRHTEQLTSKLESLCKSIDDAVQLELNQFKNTSNGISVTALKKLTDNVLLRLNFTPQSKAQTWNTLDKCIKSLFHFNMGESFKMKIIAGDAQNIATLLFGMHKNWIHETNVTENVKLEGDDEASGDKIHGEQGGYLNQYRQQVLNPKTRSMRRPLRSRKRPGIQENNVSQIEEAEMVVKEEQIVQPPTRNLHEALSHQLAESSTRSMRQLHNPGITSIEDNHRISNIQTVLDFLVATLCEAIEMSTAQAIELLTVETKQFSEIIISKGNASIQMKICNWYQMIQFHMDHFMHLLVHEPNSVDFTMSTISLGLQSESLDVTISTVALIHQFSEEFKAFESIHGDIWNWFSAFKGGIDVLLYCVHRNQFRDRELTDTVLSMILQFSHHNLIDLFSVLLRKRFTSPAQYFTTTLKLIAILCKKESALDIGKLTLGCILHAAQHCDSNFGDRDRISAFRFLFGYWIQLPEVLEQDIDTANTILTKTKLACTTGRNSESLLIALHKLLFHQFNFLSQRVRKNDVNLRHVHSVAKLLQKSLAANFALEPVRIHLLPNFMAMMINDFNNALPMEKVIANYATCAVRYSNVKLVEQDCEFLVEMANYPILEPHAAAMILSSLTETVTTNGSLSNHSSVPFLIVCKRFPDSPDLARFIEDFSLDALKLYIDQPSNSIRQKLALSILEKIIQLNIVSYCNAVEKSLINARTMMLEDHQSESTELSKLLLILQRKLPPNQEYQKQRSQEEIMHRNQDNMHGSLSHSTESSSYLSLGSFENVNFRPPRGVVLPKIFSAPSSVQQQQSHSISEAPLPMIHSPPIDQQHIVVPNTNTIQARKFRRVRADDFIDRIKQQRLAREEQQKEEQRLELERKKKVKLSLRRRFKWDTVRPKLTANQMFVDLDKQREKLHLHKSEGVGQYVEEEIEVTDEETELADQNSKVIESSSKNIAASVINDILLDAFGFELTPEPSKPRRKKVIIRRKIINNGDVVPDADAPQKTHPKEKKSQAMKSPRRRKKKKRPADTKRREDEERMRFFSNFSVMQRPIALMCRDLFLTIVHSVANGTAQEYFKKQEMKRKRLVAKRKKWRELRERRLKQSKEGHTISPDDQTTDNSDRVDEEPSAMERHRRRIEEKKLQEEEQIRLLDHRKMEEMRRRTKLQKQRLQEYREKQKVEQELKREEMKRKQKEEAQRDKILRERQEEDVKRKKQLIEEFRAKQEKERLEMLRKEEEERRVEQERRQKDIARYEKRKKRREKRSAAAAIIQRAWRRRNLMITLSRNVRRIKEERRELQLRRSRRERQQLQKQQEQENAVNETTTKEEQPLVQDSYSPPGDGSNEEDEIGEMQQAQADHKIKELI